MLAVLDDDGDDGTLQALAIKAEDAGDCSDVFGIMGEGESAWQVGDEAWLCDSGTSTHMAPSRDGMINYKITT